MVQNLEEFVEQQWLFCNCSTSSFYDDRISGSTTFALLDTASIMTIVEDISILSATTIDEEALGEAIVTVIMLVVVATSTCELATTMLESTINEHAVNFGFIGRVSSSCTHHQHHLPS